MTTTAIVYRMILRVMAGQPIDELYEDYIRARHLHVTIREILEAKKETA